MDRSTSVASPGRAGRLWFLILLLLLPACRASAPLIVAAPPVAARLAITDSLQQDPATERLIAPYRAELTDSVSEVVGTASGAFRTGKPEGTLGNFAADAMLAAAGKAIGAPVDIAVTNNGGLRVPIEPGPITVGKLFELMPFENVLVVLTLDAAQVDTLAQQLARRNGEPVAGLSFQFDAESRAVADVRVGGQPLASDRTYRLVTSDFLAAGGDNLPVLGRARARQDLGIPIRDAIIAYVREQGTVRPVTEGRIRRVNTTE